MKVVLFYIWATSVAIIIIWTISRVITALETIADSLKKLADRNK